MQDPIYLVFRGILFFQFMFNFIEIFFTFSQVWFFSGVSDSFVFLNMGVINPSFIRMSKHLIGESYKTLQIRLLSGSKSLGFWLKLCAR